MKAIPVFYSKKMVADIASFSPSASKPIHVVESWLRLGIPLHIMEPQPITKAQFYLAHDKGYVDGVLGCRIENGFGSISESVAGSLPWTSGAMLSAAREAIDNGYVAVAPVSGFHHACYDTGGAFCTFNGLMVATAVLLNEGIVKRVAILDLDQHFGDGTEDIIEVLRLQDVVLHFSAGRNWHHRRQAKTFLAMLPDMVEAFGGCDVLLFNAGVDSHVADPLGGWMTTAQLFERDSIVFETARRLCLPVVFALAGGYQSPLRRVLDLHDHTLQACAGTFGITPCHTEVSQQ